MKFLIVAGMAMLMLLVGRYFRRYQVSKKVDRQNAEFEKHKIYAEKLLLNVQMVPAPEKVKNYVLQRADFSRLEDWGLVALENSLPAKQFKSFAENMGVELEQGDNELFFLLDRVYLSQYAVDDKCVIWQWEMAG